MDPYGPEGMVKFEDLEVDQGILCCFVVSTHQNKHARSWCSTPRWLNINIWVVNLGYRNNRMVKTKHGLEAVVPQVFNFDPYP